MPGLVESEDPEDREDLEDPQELKPASSGRSLGLLSELDLLLLVPGLALVPSVRTCSEIFYSVDT